MEDDDAQAFYNLTTNYISPLNTVCAVKQTFTTFLQPQQFLSIFLNLGRFSASAFVKKRFLYRKKSNSMRCIKYLTVLSSALVLIQVFSSHLLDGTRYHFWLRTLSIFFKSYYLRVASPVHMKNVTSQC